MDITASYRLVSQMLFQAKTENCMGDKQLGEGVEKPRGMRHHLHVCLSNHRAGHTSTTR